MQVGGDFRKNKDCEAIPLRRVFCVISNVELRRFYKFVLHEDDIL